MPTGTQEYFLLGQDRQIYDILTYVCDRTGDPDCGGYDPGTNSTITLTATTEGQVVIYDHWEDGFEVDVLDPSQTTTRIFGDENTSNGDAAEYGGMVGDRLSAGSALSFFDYVDRDRLISDILFDAADRIITVGGPAAIVHAIDPTSQYIGESIVVYPRAVLGSASSYVVPVGTDSYSNNQGAYGPYAPFRFVFLQLVSYDHNVDIRVDNGQSDGVRSFRLGLGQSWSSRGWIDRTQDSNLALPILAGTTVNASGPVGALLVTASNGTYQDRFFTLVPQEQLGNDYVSAVYGDYDWLNGDHEQNLYLVNPNAEPIEVKAYDTTHLPDGRTLTIPEHGTIPYGTDNSTYVPRRSTVRLISDRHFTSLAAVDFADSAFDWGYTIVPVRLLSDSVTMSWAPGRYVTDDSCPNEGSPVWVSPTLDNTLIQVDLNGDGVFDRVDRDMDDELDEWTGDQGYVVDTLETLRIYDPIPEEWPGGNCDNTGTRIVGSARFAAAWGQDSETAGPSDPVHDKGYNVVPQDISYLAPVFTIDLQAEPEILPTYGGDIRVTLTLDAYQYGPITQVSLNHLLPPGYLYIPYSTEITLPSGVTFQTEPTQTNQGADNLLEWALGTTLAAADRLVLEFWAEAQPSVPDARQHVARATGRYLDYRLTPSDRLTVTRSNLDAFFQVNQPAVLAGESLDFSVIVTNIHPTDPADNVTVVIPLPDDTVQVPDTPPDPQEVYQGRCHCVTYELGTIQPGDSATVELTAQVIRGTPLGRRIQTYGRVTSDNNPELITPMATAIVNAPSLEPILSAPRYIQADTEMTYTVRVENEGTATANTVFLEAVIPDNTTYVDESMELSLNGGAFTPLTDAEDEDDTGTYLSAERLVRVELSAMTPSSWFEFTYKVRTNSALSVGTRILGLATVGAFEIDEVDSNLAWTAIVSANDSDGDGLSDSYETNTTYTDPHDADSDDDGLPDGTEVYGTGLLAPYGPTDPLDPDSDGDGLFDGTEVGLTAPHPDTDLSADYYVPDHDNGIHKTDPNDPDTDGGGAPDGIEDINGNGRIDPGETDPNNPGDDDSDYDGLTDGQEDANANGYVDPGETDPNDPDSDDDGLKDGEEVLTTGTNPLDADTDDDGLPDGMEVRGGGYLYRFGPSDPFDPDSDADTLPDGLEAGVVLPVSGGTNPHGYVFYGTNEEEGWFIPDADPLSQTNPNDDDTDNDGLTDDFEDDDGDGAVTNEIGGTGTTGLGETDPTRADTDGDGLQDGTEMGVFEPQGDDTSMRFFIPDQDPNTETDPLDWDSDDGGERDGSEDVNHNGAYEPALGERDPVATPWDDYGFDWDGDGLANQVELGRMSPEDPLIPAPTDPDDPDSDNDGLCDGPATVAGTCVGGEDLNANGAMNRGETDPLDADTDDDGLSDSQEVLGRGPLAAIGPLDPFDPDTDNDGLNDGYEVGVVEGIPSGYTDGALHLPYAGTADDWMNAPTEEPSGHPRDADSDDDGLPDGMEVNGTGPLAPYGPTDPLNPDTDGDLLSDGLEVSVSQPIAGGRSDVTRMTYVGTNTASYWWQWDRDRTTQTDPTDADSDDDGILDGNEDTNRNGAVNNTIGATGSTGSGETDPMNPDTDADGLQDGTEIGLVEPQGTGTDTGSTFQPDLHPATTTSPLDSDNDDGGESDGSEDPNHNGQVDDGERNPVDAPWDDWGFDYDGDGITNERELANTTDPADQDSDNDGLSDFAEVGADGEYDPLTETDPMDADTDDDGLPDGVEVRGTGRLKPFGPTDPGDGDSDQDGLGDGYEVGVAEGIPSGVSDGLELPYEGTDPDSEWALNPDPSNINHPLDADLDDDGLSDGDETLVFLTDPDDWDTDDDGLSDGLELGVAEGEQPVASTSEFNSTPYQGTDLTSPAWRPDSEPTTTTDPLDDDSDDDGILDGNEDTNRNGAADYTLGDSAGPGSGETDPTVADTDGDGIQDGTEIGLVTPQGSGTNLEVFVPDADFGESRTDPLDIDSDDGGEGDGSEDGNRNGAYEPELDERNPVAVPWDDFGFDYDGDGLQNQLELTRGTDPADADCDNDGLCDGPQTVEDLCLGGEDLNANGVVDTGETNPLDADMDDDGLSDGEELLGTGRLAAFGPTDPFDPDTDQDLLSDGYEVGVTTPIPSGTSATLHIPYSGTDIAADGWMPSPSSSTAINPLDADTDDDGLLDGDEVLGTGPLTDIGGASSGGGGGTVVRVTTDPLDWDSDDDLLSDGLEAGVHEPIPGDVSDGNATEYLGTDVLQPSWQPDSHPASVTHPLDDDTDNDGILDGNEDPNYNGAVDIVVMGGTGTTGEGETDPLKRDTDDDGLQDGTELGFTAPQGDDTWLLVFIPDADPDTLTNPVDTDTDDGGEVDGQEDTNHNGYYQPELGERNPVDAPWDDRGFDYDGDGLNNEVETAIGSDPQDPDTDGDGLLDGEELAYGTSPIDADSDDDGLPDGVEVEGTGPLALYGSTDPTYPDSDGDGLPDGLEAGITEPVAAGESDVQHLPFQGTDVLSPSWREDADPLTTTDPTQADTDSDGLSDSEEDDNGDGAVVNSIGGTGTIGEGETDPNQADTDGDGLLDGAERLLHGTDPLDTDSDDDGVLDGLEVGLRMDPLDADSDEDGIPDGLEPSFDVDSDGDGLINALDCDSDNDLLFDGTELGYTPADLTEATDLLAGAFVGDADPASTTDPLDADSDGGGVSDGMEDSNLNGAVDEGETDPNDPDDDLTPADGDSDGLPDAVEFYLGTDPADADSDDDGVLDGDEPNPAADDDGDGLINPLDADSDDDLLFDGTELGVTTEDLGVDTDLSAGCFVADADPLTTTSALVADTDGGGVPDGAEDSDLDGALDEGETDPTDPSDDLDLPLDSDGDGLPDSLEIAIGSRPLDADSDDDGLLDGLESNIVADDDGDGLINVLDPDSDGDGLPDGLEAGVTEETRHPHTEVRFGWFLPDADPATTTSMVNPDTDGGGVWDGQEDANLDGAVDEGELDPNDPTDDIWLLDSDGDELFDAVELLLGTDPYDADSDDDGVPDGQEPGYDLDVDGDGLIGALDPDSDDDGLLDGTEMGITAADLHRDTDLSRGLFQPDVDPTTTTDPLVADTDDGGLIDGNEDINLNGTIDFWETDPNEPRDDLELYRDTDGDGLVDRLEEEIGTDPLDADSDDDGVLDGQEYNFRADSDQDGQINAMDPDSDDDGLFDGTEMGLVTDDLSTHTNLAARHFSNDTDPTTTTSPIHADTDGGGLIDGNEDTNLNGAVDEGETDPNDPEDDGLAGPDSDGDGLVDALELTLGSDPHDADSDDDGLIDGLEHDPAGDRDSDALISLLDPDSDGDHLPDGLEVGITEATRHPDTDLEAGIFISDADPASTTSPVNRDSDRGGIADGIEDTNRNGSVDVGEIDPNLGLDDLTWLDSDGDELTDAEELSIGTDPFDRDSDDDGVPDNLEPAYNTDTDGDGLVNALDPDSDDDGLLDGTEMGVTAADLTPDTDVTKRHFRSDRDPTTTTDPLDPDTDGGGVADGLEDLNLDGRVDRLESDPDDPSDDLPAAADSDDDGLPDALETLLGTDPHDADSDDDGVLDGHEPNFSDDTDTDGLINPLDADSDNDHILDGTELGVTQLDLTLDTDRMSRAFFPDHDPTTTTSAVRADTDGGGLTDGNEDTDRNGAVDSRERDPNDAADDYPTPRDTDRDGLRDRLEILLGSDPDDADSDDDGLLDGQEPNAALDTDGDGVINLLDPDSDGDDLPDGLEGGVSYATRHPHTDLAAGVFRSDAHTATTTSVVNPDTDGGGLADGEEDLNRNGSVDSGETDPNDPADDASLIDRDGDGLSDLIERSYGTDPLDADSDDDGVLDGEEPAGLEDSDLDGLINALDPDSDNDGLFDGTELGVVTGQLTRATDLSRNRFVPDADPTTTTDPLLADTDNGSVPDGIEDRNGNGRIDPGETDPNLGDDDLSVVIDDRDGDGLPDDLERAIGTDPYDADSDDDGVPDGLEPNYRDDGDGDGLINALDPDSDNDSLFDGTEMGLTAADLGPDTDLSRGAFVADTDPTTTTSPLHPDTDLGGVFDGSEDFNLNGAIDEGETDPTDPADDDLAGMEDGDGDGLPDRLELALGSDPFDADSDDDGLVDGREPNGSADTDGDGVINLLDPDSDGDGLPDGLEAGVTETTRHPDTDLDAGAFLSDLDPRSTTSPVNPDTDGGGVADGLEDANRDGAYLRPETDPNNPADDYGRADSDRDGLPDRLEEALGSDPFDYDSDDDGVPDGLEPNRDEDTDGDGLINLLDPDSDDDGLFDGTEMGYCLADLTYATDLRQGRFVEDADPATTTDPLRADTDRGGVADGFEDTNLNGMVDEGETDPEDPTDDDPSSVVDSDDDGLPDAFERMIGSDPEDGDSDDDGLADGDEPNPAEDCDGDGAINLVDPDSDDDGLFDGTEMGLTEGDIGPDTDVEAGFFIPDADPTTTTSPIDRDSDGDGVMDGNEDTDLDGAVDEGERDPTWDEGVIEPPLDTDGDGLADALDAYLGTSPTDADSDDDGLIDGREHDPAADTDGDGLISPLDPDGDGDGLPDGLESGVTEVDRHPDTDASAGWFVADRDPSTITSPLLRDTDGGGVPDNDEDDNANGRVDPGETDPADRHDDHLTDTDRDGLSNRDELTSGTSPYDADSDDDGLLDGAEVYQFGTGPTDPDSDSDGLMDGLEAGIDRFHVSSDTTDPALFTPDLNPATTTDPLLADTDGGGHPDGQEDLNANGRVDPGETDPNDPRDDVGCLIIDDCDGDGLLNLFEIWWGSDPYLADSDNGGAGDGTEHRQGTNPLNPEDDFPPPPKEPGCGSCRSLEGSDHGLGAGLMLLALVMAGWRRRRS
ncbi:MAG: hypothetical protein JW797_01775 [Bradymonadales bacterium]|nr:hypothetical protein [Bradymonadales bacterium]